MLYALTCLDRPDHGAVRAENRAAHLAYLQEHGAAVRFAGPLLAEDNTTMVGSLLLLDLPDRAAVDAFCAGDPYTRAGLFAEVTVRPVRQVLPAPQ